MPAAMNKPPATIPTQAKAWLRRLGRPWRASTGGVAVAVFDSGASVTLCLPVG
jgi:hypothetical protein